jgi:hypothetical protein
MHLEHSTVYEVCIPLSQLASRADFLECCLQTVWIVDSVTWTVLWPMIKETTSGVPMQRSGGMLVTVAHVTCCPPVPLHVWLASRAVATHVQTPLQALSSKGLQGCSSASRHTCSMEAMQS